MEDTKITIKSQSPLDDDDYQIIIKSNALQGPPGPRGPAGSPLPEGGTENDILVKQSSDDYDAEWQPLSTDIILKGLGYVPVNPTALSQVAFSGDFNDLINNPLPGSIFDLIESGPGVKFIHNSVYARVEADFGSGPGKVTEGDDPRLSNARPPTPHTHTVSQISDFSSGVDNRISVQKGVPNGLATLNSSGKIPESQLPAGSNLVTSVNGKIGDVVLDSDEISEGSTNLYMTSAEKSKLDGIEENATENRPDSELLDRANHTGTQDVSTITGLANVATSGSYNDLTDIPVPAELIPGNHIDIEVDSNGDKIISVETLSLEDIEETADLKHFTVEEQNKLSGIAPGATANSSDAYLLDRTNHTGTQDVSTITGLADVATSGSYNDLTDIPEGYQVLAGDNIDIVVDSNGDRIISVEGLTLDDIAETSTNKHFTATEKTKLSGIAPGSTVNSSDATLLNRANHTGTQLSSTISDFASSVDDRVSLQKAVPNGLATLDASGKIPEGQLPASATGKELDFFDTFADFPLEGETDVFYIAKDTRKTYYWESTEYILIAEVLETSDDLPEGSTNLYMTSAEKSKLEDLNTSDDLPEGSTNLYMTSTERTKLSGVATGATANSSDATLLNRANHTGTQLAATISDFSTEVEEIINLQKGVPDGIASLDSAGKVPAVQLPSYVDDVLEFDTLTDFPTTGETGKIYIAIDTGRTYRWSGSIYVELYAGEVLSVNGKTGTVVLDADDLSEGTTNLFLSSAERTKLSGVATGATANSTDSFLLDRANHTGTQAASTITGLADVATSGSYNDLLDTPDPLETSDDLPEGSTNLYMTSAERTKLSGVATGATANSPDAYLLDRTNHTGTQLSSTISDFTSSVNNSVADLLVEGDNISLTYDGLAGTLRIDSAGAATTYTTYSFISDGSITEFDTSSTPPISKNYVLMYIGGVYQNKESFEIDSAGWIVVSETISEDIPIEIIVITPSVNVLNTVTDGSITSEKLSVGSVILTSETVTGILPVSKGGTGVSSLEDLSTALDIPSNLSDLSGTLDDISAGTTNVHFTSAEKTKLSGVATGATANSSDATLLARANHTGTQAASTITNFTEEVQDAAWAAVSAGTGTQTLITVTYQDSTNDVDFIVNNNLSLYSNTNSKFVRSEPTGITGADQITNMVSLTQSEYDAIGSPNASTLYIITG